MSTSILIFGKPDTFEILEFNNFNYHSNTQELSIVEPEIKTRKISDGNAIRFRYINGFYYLLLYTYAQGFSSSRPGNCCGVGIKSKKRIAFSKKNIDLLEQLLQIIKQNAFKQNTIEFAANNLQALLDKSSILSATNNLEKEVEFLESSSYTDFKNSQFLLVLEDFSNINSLPENTYDDFFVVQNKEILQDEMNRTINSNCRTNNFYQTKDKKIVKYAEPIVTNHSQKSNQSFSGSATKGNETLINIIQRDLEEEKRKNEHLKVYLETIKTRVKRKIFTLSIATLIFGLTTLAFFFTWVFNDSPTTEPIVTEAIESTSGVENNIEIQSEINKGKNSLDAILADDRLDKLSLLCDGLGKSRKDNKNLTIKDIDSIQARLKFFEIDTTLALYQNLNNDRRSLKTKVAEKKESKIQQANKENGANQGVVATSNSVKRSPAEVSKKTEDIEPTNKKAKIKEKESEINKLEGEISNNPDRKATDVQAERLKKLKNELETLKK